MEKAYSMHVIWAHSRGWTCELTVADLALLCRAGTKAWRWSRVSSGRHFARRRSRSRIASTQKFCGPFWGGWSLFYLKIW
jgi:hypothetical protein